MMDTSVLAAFVSIRRYATDDWWMILYPDLERSGYSRFRHYVTFSKPAHKHSHPGNL